MARGASGAAQRALPGRSPVTAPLCRPACERTEAPASISRRRRRVQIEAQSPDSTGSCAGARERSVGASAAAARARAAAQSRRGQLSHVADAALVTNARSSPFLMTASASDGDPCVRRSRRVASRLKKCRGSFPTAPPAASWRPRAPRPVTGGASRGRSVLHTGHTRIQAPRPTTVVSAAARCPSAVPAGAPW